MRRQAGSNNRHVIHELSQENCLLKPAKIFITKEEMLNPVAADGDNPALHQPDNPPTPESPSEPKLMDLEEPPGIPGREPKLPRNQPHSVARRRVSIYKEGRRKTEGPEKVFKVSKCFCFDQVGKEGKDCW